MANSLRDWFGFGQHDHGHAHGGHTHDHHGHDHHGPHGHTADPHLSVIKILQADEGRYVPPEGQTHQAQNTVSTSQPPVAWRDKIE